jgi:hypothetical protein
LGFEVNFRRHGRRLRRLIWGQKNFSFGGYFYSYIFDIYSLIFIVFNFLLYNFPKPIAHNVPAVYDIFASPIKETAGFQGLQKCGWS